MSERTPDLAAALATLPHFRGLPADLLERVAACARARELRAGEAVFQQGEPSRAFFAIREGGVRVYRLSPDGREQVLHHLREGHTFAEAALLSMGRYPAHAVATRTPTRLLEIGAGFPQLLREDPRLAPAMVGSLSMWLVGLVDRIEELSVASAGARLARYLLKLPASGAADALAIELPLAKKELAGHLAIAPETLSRLLRRWQDSGVVRTDGPRLTILDSRVLVAIADRDEAAE